ncbi:MAG: helix-turn-helix domain-containing protein [Candidatus Heteroscillospira sp.]
MDCTKVGKLICALRREQGMTQRALAEKLGLSDRTISKWERGLGCPDVSLLTELASVLGVDTKRLLAGELAENDTDGGNMRRLKFYVCPTCGNIITATGAAELSCCGRTLVPLKAEKPDGEHAISIENMEDEWFITFPHGMEKEHFISFFAYVRFDRVLLVRLYPEQGSELRFPAMRGGRLYWYCSEHGLFELNPGK